jgi:hypothetical protein
MLNKTAFEYMTNLQYKVKDLTEAVRAFKSGEKYLWLEKYREDCLALLSSGGQENTIK